MKHLVFLMLLLFSFPAFAQEQAVEGVDVGGTASAFAYDAKSGHLFAVLKGGNQIVEIDPGVGTVRTLETRAGPIAGVVKGGSLVSLDADARAVTVFDLTTGKRTGSIELPLTNPSWLSASERAEPYVYVASKAGQEGVLQIDVRACRVRRRLPLWRSNGCFQVSRSGTSATDGEFVYSLNEPLGLAYSCRRIESASGPVRADVTGVSWIIGSSVYDIQGRQRLAIATTPLAVDPRGGLALSATGREGVFDGVQTYGLSEARPLETIALRNFSKEARPDLPPAAFVDSERDRVVVAWADRYGTLKRSVLKSTNPPYLIARNPFPLEVPEAATFRWTPEWAVPELVAGTRYSLEGAPAGMTLDGATVVYNAPPSDYTEKGFKYVIIDAGDRRSVLQFSFRGSRVTIEPSLVLDFAIEGAAYDEPRGRLFLLDAARERVVEVDLDKGGPSEEYATEKDPVAIAVADKALLVLNRASGTLTIHQIGAPKNAQSVRLSKEIPATLTVAGSYAYVGGGRGPFWLAQIDIAAAKERAILRESHRTGACTISSDGRLIYELALRGAGGGELHTLDAAKPAVSVDPVQRTMLSFIPATDPQGRGWIFPSVLMDRNMSKPLAEFRCDAPVGDPSGAWVFGWGPKEVHGGPDYHGYLMIMSGQTFKAARTARLAWLAHPPGFSTPPRPDRTEPPRYLVADGHRQRVIAACCEKVYIVRYDELALPRERVLRLDPPFPEEVPVGTSVDLKLEFAKGTGLEGAAISLRKGLPGLSIESGRCRFTPMAHQIGAHEVELCVRAGDQDHVLPLRLRVVPRFVTIPDEVSSLTLDAGGSSGLIVVGSRVSRVDLKSGDTRACADNVERVDAVARTARHWIIGDTGVLRVFDAGSLKELGVIRTGGTQLRSIVALPGEDRIVFVASEKGWHHVDLEKRVARAALLNAPTTGRGLSIERLSGPDHYLFYEQGRVFRVIWEEDRLLGQDLASCPAAVPLVLREQGLVLIPGVGMTSEADTTTVLKPSSRRELPSFDLPAVWSALPSRRLLAAFDGYTIRLIDPWKLTEKRAINVRESPVPSRVVAPADAGRFALQSFGDELIAWVRGRVYRVAIEDLGDEYPKVAAGRFVNRPSTSVLKPGDSFSYAPKVEGFGRGLVFFLKQGPAGMTVSETTGEVRWTAPTEFKGAQVQIGVKDAEDIEGSLRFTLIAVPK